MTKDEEEALCSQCENSFIAALKVVLNTTQNSLSDTRLQQIIFTAFTTSLIKTYVIMAVDIAKNPNEEKLQSLEMAKEFIEIEINSLKEKMNKIILH